MKIFILASMHLKGPDLNFLFRCYTEREKRVVYKHSCMIAKALLYVCAFFLGTICQVAYNSSGKFIKVVQGNICCRAELEKAMEGVDYVIHSAGLISFATFPDLLGMEEINVDGTRLLVEVAITCGVSGLIYTSTVDVVIGHQEVHFGDEGLPLPDHFLFPGYPASKARAEKIILSADGLLTAKGNGHVIRTCSLRPCVMYGPLDPYYVSRALSDATKNGGVLQQIGNGKALFQQAYVGNVAWAHVCALEALIAEEAVQVETTSFEETHGPMTENLGETPADVTERPPVYFITDNTPLMNAFSFMKPFLELRGMRLSSSKLPYFPVYVLLLIVETFLKLISPIWKFNLPFQLCSLEYVNKTIYFNRKKAERELRYEPIYSFGESMEHSLKYYEHCPLSK